MQRVKLIFTYPLTNFWACTLIDTYRIAGKFRGTIFLWLVLSRTSFQLLSMPVARLWCKMIIEPRKQITPYMVVTKLLLLLVLPGVSSCTPGTIGVVTSRVDEDEY